MKMPFLNISIPGGSPFDIFYVLQAKADRSPLFFKHICMDQMGEHYNLFNYDPDQSCFGIQIQPVYDKGMQTEKTGPRVQE